MFFRKAVNCHHDTTSQPKRNKSSQSPRWINKSSHKNYSASCHVRGNYLCQQTRLLSLLIKVQLNSQQLFDILFCPAVTKNIRQFSWNVRERVHIIFSSAVNLIFFLPFVSETSTIRTGSLLEQPVKILTQITGPANWENNRARSQLST